MSPRCPSFPELLAARRQGDDPPGWRAALDHLDSCPDCRRVALELEPTLVFRRLPAPAVDVAAIRQGVAALRRTSRLGSATTSDRRRDWRRPARIAAAVLLAVGGLALGPVPAPESDGRMAGVPVAGASVLGEAALGFERLEQLPAPSDLYPDGPYIEDIDLLGARLYQHAEGEISVSMIVHSSLDV